MRHEYYGYTKDELKQHAKFPMTVMEDNDSVFSSMAKEMTDEIEKNNKEGKRTVRWARWASIRTLWIG